MVVMPFDSAPWRTTLLQFLRQSRLVHAEHLAGTLLHTSTAAPVYVLGNPSADLDSIVSAIVYSYFADGRLPLNGPRPHVPLINLPDVPAGPELCRLRPEFVKALWLATNEPPERDKWGVNEEEATGQFLQEHMVTVADFKAGLRQCSQQDTSDKDSARWEIDATLVDWNALPIRAADGTRSQGSIHGLENVDINVIGCVDHHVDEDFVLSKEDIPAGQPLHVEPGPGSCTSLIVDLLRARHLWPERSALPSLPRPPASTLGTRAAEEEETAATDSMEQLTASRPGASPVAVAESQVARLALTAVLIDTADLTAKGRVKDVDRSAVTFLESRVRAALQRRDWNRTPLFQAVQETKQNSLDLLTVDEILGRDYKEWTEKSQDPAVSIKLGFCCVVKPMCWVSQKAGSAQALLDAIQSFACAKKLDVVAILTASSQLGQLKRELFVWALPCPDRAQYAHVVLDAIKRFTAQAAGSLRLQDWNPAPAAAESEAVRRNSLGEKLGVCADDADEISSKLNYFEEHGSSVTWRRLWDQQDITKSRKQVAPLLRDAVSNHAKQS